MDSIDLGRSDLVAFRAQLQFAPPWAETQDPPPPISFQSLLQSVQQSVQSMPQTYAGIGLGAVVVVMLGSRWLWGSRELRALRTDLKSLYRTLEARLISQKHLERDYAAVQDRSRDWARRADAATRTGAPALLDQVLAGKQIADQESAQASRALQDANTQVIALRDSITQVQLQIDLHTRKRRRIS